MTNSPIPAKTTPSRILLPPLAIGLFIASVPLVLFGGFLATVHGDSTLDFAIFQTRLGTVAFWVGIGFVLTGFVLDGTRHIAQQQVDILQKISRD
jgi:hypothetical protein